MATAASQLLSQVSFSRLAVCCSRSPLLSSLSLNNSLPLIAYLFFLKPLTFYLNMLLVLLHVMAHDPAPEAPLPVFLMKHLPGAARAVSFAALLFGTPLWIHAAVAEESIGLAIGAALVCLASVSILSSVFKKLLISCCHAGIGVVPGFLALCLSTGFLFFVDPTLAFSDTNHNDHLTIIHTGLHYLLLFVTLVIFLHGITLVTVCVSMPAEGHKGKHNLVMIVLGVAFATLVVVAYTKVYVVIAGMDALAVDAAEK